ncbi:hypothetical protein J4464_02450 [Candidatus Woesearchaeota archaeon]|nr:hypothetical protein [Candidatus Woesearchaeota archaeon]
MPWTFMINDAETLRYVAQVLDDHFHVEPAHAEIIVTATPTGAFELQPRTRFERILVRRDALMESRSIRGASGNPCGILMLGDQDSGYTAFRIYTRPAQGL